MNDKTELKIIIDHQGIRCVQIIGAPDTHKAGHDLYLKIIDLIQDFDNEIKKRLKEDNTEPDLNQHTSILSNN